MKKKEDGKKRRRIERGKKLRLSLRPQSRGKELPNQDHNFKASTSASTKRSSCKSLQNLAGKIQNEPQSGIASNNSRGSWQKPRSVKHSMSVSDRSDCE